MKTTSTEKKPTPTELKDQITALEDVTSLQSATILEYRDAYERASLNNRYLTERLKDITGEFNSLSQRFAQVTEVSKLQAASINKLNRLSELRREFIVDMEDEAGERVPLPTHLFEV